jgi:RNA polymerase sigma factor (sigma-70 family)
MNSVIRCLCSTALAGLTDRELVDALVIRRDAASFEALLRRHGPMVLAVCQRVLHNAHDAEDAFQSTFLVLLRKAANIRKPEAIGSWLYGVAYLTARKARVVNARRRVTELQAASRPSPETAEPSVDLDEALNALPEIYRVPVVLCELEGRSRKQVARQLNIPEGTLSSRLAKARKMLANRLRRSGQVSAGMVPIATSLPVLLIAATVKAAGHVLAGRGVTGAVSAKVLTLSEGVVKTMFVNKLKTLTAALVILGSLGVGTDRLARLALAERPTATKEEQPKDPTDPTQRAAAELATARADKKLAEANLAAAQARVDRKEAEYRDALQRAIRPDEKAALDAQARAIASRFKYRVPVEIGSTETKDGGRIEILEVWGTQPDIRIGGYYLVHGKYAMPSYDRGTLYFHLTATTAANAFGPELDLQFTTVQKGEGEFTLLHTMGAPGYFHLHLIGGDQKQSSTVANVYFGTGDNVWRKK